MAQILKASMAHSKPFTSHRQHERVVARTARPVVIRALSRTHEPASESQQHPGSVLAAAVLAAAVLTSQPTAATAAQDVAASTSGSAAVPTAYFGNGCFWGRQKDFVDTELRLGRTDPAEISALVGYAGGRQTGPGDKVCYYYNGDPRTIYERLGHAEVVQVALSGEQQSAEQQFSEQYCIACHRRAFAETYFKEFQAAPRGRGMMRLDPQDSGPGYRNVVGLPGGVASPYFKVLQEANVNHMELREGQGNIYERGQPKEGDEINMVWVVDSDKLPFYRAEVYHQFHNGLGKAFSPTYTRDLKAAVTATGKIGPTGCLEVPF